MLDGLIPENGDEKRRKRNADLHRGGESGRVDVVWQRRIGDCASTDQRGKAVVDQDSARAEPVGHLNVDFVLIEKVAEIFVVVVESRPLVYGGNDLSRAFGHGGNYGCDEAESIVKFDIGRYSASDGAELNFFTDASL